MRMNALAHVHGGRRHRVHTAECACSRVLPHENRLSMSRCSLLQCSRLARSRPLYSGGVQRGSKNRPASIEPWASRRQASLLALSSYHARQPRRTRRRRYAKPAGPGGAIYGSSPPSSGAPTPELQPLPKQPLSDQGSDLLLSTRMGQVGARVRPVSQTSPKLSRLSPCRLRFSRQACGNGILASASFVRMPAKRRPQLM